MAMAMGMEEVEKVRGTIPEPVQRGGTIHT